MKRRCYIIVSALLCGMVFAGCGGGNSGVKKNQYLGSLPAIYADYNAKKEAHEAKMEKEGNNLISGGEKNMDKIMKLMKEDEETTKNMKDKLKSDVSAEITKIAGTEIPVSYSKALLDSDELFYDVFPVKLVDNKGNIAITIVLSAKYDFEVPRMKGYDYSAYFRLIAADGSTISKSTLLPVKLENKTLLIAAGQQLLENNFLLYISNQPERYANFSGIEFISKDEYNESK